jgi:negative regulator of sigma E activity
LRISEQNLPVLNEISRDHQINDSMKTTNFRTVEELNLDVNAPTVTPTKVQNDKIVRALKKLSFTNPDEASIVKMVSAFVALGVNPQAKSSSWLARRLKNHLQAFGLVGAPAPVVVEEPTTDQPAADRQEPVAEPAAVEIAKAKSKKAAGKKE